MRIAALLVSLVLFPASQLFAAPVLFLEFLNSDLTFGTGNPDQSGKDLSSFDVAGSVPGMDFWNSGYLAQAGALDHETLNVNGAGDVIGSEYVYTGGVFELFFVLEQNGTQTSGSWVAPILTLTITAGEGDGQSANASYVLGPGLLDQPIATALGIDRHIQGGSAFSQLLLTDHGNRSGVAGDHSTPERQAWDGVTDITLDVPEPASFLLLTAGAGALWARRRSRRG